MNNKGMTIQDMIDKLNKMDKIVQVCREQIKQGSKMYSEAQDNYDHIASSVCEAGIGAYENILNLTGELLHPMPENKHEN